VGERGREGGWRGGERGREENGGRETFFFERRESSERFNNNIPLQIFGRPFNLRAARRRMRRARGAASAKGAGEKKPPRAQERAGGYEPSSPSFFLFPTLFFTSSFLRCSTFFVSVCARARVCVTEPHSPRFEILKVESRENKWRAVSFFFLRGRRFQIRVGEKQRKGTIIFYLFPLLIITMSFSSSFAGASTSGRKTSCVSSGRRRQSPSRMLLTVAKSATITSRPSASPQMPPSVQLGKPLSLSLSRMSPLSPRLQRGPAPPCAIVKKELVSGLCESGEAFFSIDEKAAGNSTFRFPFSPLPPPPPPPPLHSQPQPYRHTRQLLQDVCSFLKLHCDVSYVGPATRLADLAVASARKRAREKRRAGFLGLAGLVGGGGGKKKKQTEEEEDGSSTQTASSSAAEASAPSSSSSSSLTEPSPIQVEEALVDLFLSLEERFDLAFAEDEGKAARAVTVAEVSALLAREIELINRSLRHIEII